MPSPIAFLQRLTLAIFFLVFTAHAGAASLTTTYSGGNNHRGNTFDVIATSAIYITQFDLSPMGNTSYEIYYRVGSGAGHESVPGDWTLLQSGSISTGVAPVVLTQPLNLAANQTYSFYVTSSNTAVSLNYSNGSSFGAVYATDGVLTIFEGNGLEYPFTAGSGALYTPRVWNGTIHYSLGSVPIVQPGALPAGEVGQAYAPTTLAVVGGTAPYTWSATGLPPGLSMNASTGQITGTPTASGSFTVEVRVTDGTAPTALTHAIRLPLVINAARVPAQVTAVPAMGELGLGLLAGLAATLGLRARRRRSQQA